MLCYQHVALLQYVLYCSAKFDQLVQQSLMQQSLPDFEKQERLYNVYQQYALHHQMHNHLDESPLNDNEIVVSLEMYFWLHVQVTFFQ